MKKKNKTNVKYSGTQQVLGRDQSQRVAASCGQTIPTTPQWPARRLRCSPTNCKTSLHLQSSIIALSICSRRQPQTFKNTRSLQATTLRTRARTTAKRAATPRGRRRPPCSESAATISSSTNNTTSVRPPPPTSANTDACSPPCGRNTRTRSNR